MSKELSIEQMFDDLMVEFDEKVCKTQLIDCFNRLKQENVELNAENERLYKKISNLKEDLIHCHEKVFYRECNVVLRENEIKAQGSKETAKEIITEITSILRKFEVKVNKDSYELCGFIYIVDSSDIDMCLDKLADKYGVDIAE